MIETTKVDFDFILSVIDKYKLLIITGLTISLLMFYYHTSNRSLLYKSKATVEIGNFVKYDYNRQEIDSPRRLNKILNIKYSHQSIVHSIKELDQFIEIVTISDSHKKSEDKINEILSFIDKIHNKKILSIKESYSKRLKRIVDNINIIKEKQLELLTEHNIEISHSSILNSLQLITILNGKNEEKEKLKHLLKPHNYKKTNLIGDIYHDNKYINIGYYKLLTIYIFIGIFFITLLSIFLELINIYTKGRKKTS